MWEETTDFARALNLLNEWKRVYSQWRNWQNQDRLMFITKQVSDENSKMTVSYLFMTILEKWKPDIVVPRTPSQRDLRILDWRNGEELELLENRSL